jgi:hypothetical protein
LAELASPAEEQIEYLGQHPNLDLLTNYVEWLTTVDPVLMSSGTLSLDALRATEAVRESLVALDIEMAADYERSGSSAGMTLDGLRNDPRWDAIRVLAQTALAAFREMGIPTPRLSDNDFDVPREDAP